MFKRWSFPAMWGVEAKRIEVRHYYQKYGIIPYIPSIATGEISFSEFKTCVAAKEKNNSHEAEEMVRIFIWNLVRKIQDYHKVGKCPKKITSKYILVGDYIPTLVGDKVKYTEENAIKNYHDLHTFLEQEFFPPDEEQHYCMKKFLQLLIDENPVVNKELIVRHYAILSTWKRVSVANNLLTVPSRLPYPLRKKFYNTIDRVNVDVNWQTKIRSNSFLREVYDGEETDSYVPLAYSVLKFWRNCHNHCGVDKKRTVFKQKGGLERYLDTLKLGRAAKDKRRKVIQDCYVGGNVEPNISQPEVLLLLMEQFPEFITDVQHAFHKKGILEYLCIMPHDKLQS